MRIPKRQLAGLIGREELKADAYETVLHAITESTMETTHETELAHPTFNGEAFVACYRDATESKEFAMGLFRVREL